SEARARTHSRVTKIARGLDSFVRVDTLVIKIYFGSDSGVHRTNEPRLNLCTHSPAFDVRVQSTYRFQVDNVFSQAVHRNNVYTCPSVWSYVRYRRCWHGHAQPETAQ
ncbi:unnamed protein product, partial [Laminaria digitata]